MDAFAGCRVTTETVTGWRAVILDNGLIQVVLLPDRGAEICRLIHKPTGVPV